MLVNLDNDNSFIDEEDFATLYAASEKGADEGAIQTGEIVEINDEYAMVAIPHAKREARLRISEITKNGELLFKKGDRIEVFVSQSRQGPSASYIKALYM